MKHLRLNNNNNKTGAHQLLEFEISQADDLDWETEMLAFGFFTTEEAFLAGIQQPEMDQYELAMQEDREKVEDDQLESSPGGKTNVEFFQRQADLAVEVHVRAQDEFRSAIAAELGTFQVAVLRAIAEMAAAEMAVALAAAEEAALIAYAGELVVWRDKAKNQHQRGFAHRALRHTMGAVGKAAAEKAAALHTVKELSWPQLPVL